MTSKVNLFIPYVFSDVTEQKIRSVIEDYEVLGKVESVELVKKKKADGSHKIMAFVEMNSWSDSDYAQGRMADILNGREYKINYEQYYNQSRANPFWIVVENKKSTFKQQTPAFPSPPKLVRNDVPMMNRGNSSSSTVYDGDIYTLSLVDDSYVKMIEDENIKLRSLIVEMETKMVNMLSSSSCSA